MALQDFNENREYGIGDVKSRKNIENLSVPKEAWVALIGTAGGYFPSEHVDEFTNEELKSVIKLYDQQIDDEEYFGFPTDADEVRDIKDNREDLVDILKERKE